MNILFVSSEVHPFSKTGGLADVSEALPVALRKKNINILLFTPFYKTIKEKNFKIKDTGITLKIFVDFHWEYVKILKTEHRGVTVYFADNDKYFNVENFYEGDSVEIRFGLFCYSAIELCKTINFTPDIFHLNDWQTALVSVLLNTNYGNNDFFASTKTLLTIHNLAYQGYYPKNTLNRLGITSSIFHYNGIEFYNQVNFLKGGIVFSDFINTVSPTYAKEILTFEAGRGLHGVLKQRKDRLTGILNGIDYEEWSPENDGNIVANYSLSNINNKLKNKIELLDSLNLKQNEKIPVFAFVGRLIEQKGISLIIEAMEELMLLNVAIVILGTGDKYFQEKLTAIKRKYNDKISLNFTFNEKLSRKIYAGSDFLFMPSLYEPCGISQMIAMRYGTIPIAREVGGLKDSIKNGVTGYLFENFTKNNFIEATLHALECYSNKKTFDITRKNCMKEDFSWETSCEPYIKLYNKIKEECL